MALLACSLEIIFSDQIPCVQRPLTPCTAACSRKKTPPLAVSQGSLMSAAKLIGISSLKDLSPGLLEPSF